MAVATVVIVGALALSAPSLLRGTTRQSHPSVSPPLMPDSRAAREALTFSGPTGETSIGSITIPALGIDRVDIFDRGLDDLRRMLVAPGRVVTHYSPSTPLQGTGNVVLYGHDDIQGGIFRNLDRLRGGDVIAITSTSGETTRWVVEGPPFFVTPSTISILGPSLTPRLTLFSCYPYGVDNQRVVVNAVPAPAPPFPKQSP
ncbi:MAG: hypothetical protein NVS3B24_04050 [Candidatus Dormibacteria bacterium]